MVEYTDTCIHGCVERSNQGGFTGGSSDKRSQIMGLASIDLTDINRCQQSFTHYVNLRHLFHYTRT